MNILFPGELNYSGEDLFFCGGELKGGELSFQGRTYFWRAGGEHKKKPMLCGAEPERGPIVFTLYFIGVGRGTGVFKFLAGNPPF